MTTKSFASVWNSALKTYRLWTKYVGRQSIEKLLSEWLNAVSLFPYTWSFLQWENAPITTGSAWYCSSWSWSQVGKEKNLFLQAVSVCLPVGAGWEFVSCYTVAQADFELLPLTLKFWDYRHEHHAQQISLYERLRKIEAEMETTGHCLCIQIYMQHTLTDVRILVGHHIFNTLLSEAWDYSNLPRSSMCWVVGSDSDPDC